MVALFFVLALLTIYPYVIYPVVAAVLARLRPRPPRTSDWEPSISVIIPAYNEREVIARKLENTLALDYPKHRLEILVGSDGSDDGTPDIARQFESRGVRVFAFPRRRGKPSVITDLAAAGTGDILVMTDASAILDARAVREIARGFGSPDIGVVSGEMEADEGRGVTSAITLYRRTDNRLRRHESLFHSSIGAAGALHGIRRELFTVPAPHTILDDLVIPLRTVERGYRVIIRPEAHFVELERPTLTGEFRRKTRTLAGNYQALGWLWRLLVPGRSPIWFQLLSHKALRLATPYLMLLLLPLNIALAHRPLFAALLAGQALFYLLALTGFAFRNRKLTLPRAINAPFIFLVMQIANLSSLYFFLAGRVTMKWSRNT
jgi:cellulose synthase/poly-beta-1,6-N-acetylglucosamine synthase-like glycosyltransferase